MTPPRRRPARTPARPAVAEPLEVRRLLAATVELVGGVVTIVGDAAADRIDVAPDFGLVGPDGSSGPTVLTPTDLVSVTLNGAAAASYRADQVGRVVIDSGGGNDTIDVSARVRTVVDAGDGDDFVSLGRGDDQVFGRLGNDTVLGNGGRDVVFGGGGDDEISGGSGPDVLLGEVGDDTVTGGDGDDRLFGDGITADGQPAAQDTDGDDVLQGSAGKDTLYGGLGDDSISGGGGRQDLANYSERTADLTLMIGGDPEFNLGDNGQEDETDFISIDVEKLNGGSGDDQILGFAVTGRAGDQASVRRVDAGIDNVLWGGPGDDTILGGGGDDFLIGFDGDDRLTGDAGGDTLQGGLGADELIGDTADQDELGDPPLPGVDVADYSDRGDDLTLTLGGSGDSGAPDPADGSVDGPGAERDTISSSVDAIFGGSGDDFFSVILARDVDGNFVPPTGVLFDGGPGDDRLTGNALGDTLIGGPGRDTLEGFGGDDFLSARDGDRDTLDGGDGDDSASVDAGRDAVENVESLA